MRTRLPTYRAVKHLGGYVVVKIDYSGFYRNSILTRQALPHALALHIVATLQRDQQNDKYFGMGGPYIGFPTRV